MPTLQRLPGAWTAAHPEPLGSRLDRRLRWGQLGSGWGEGLRSLSTGTHGHSGRAGLSSGPTWLLTTKVGHRPFPPWKRNTARAVWVSGSRGHARCREQRWGQLLPRALATAEPTPGQRDARPGASHSSGPTAASGPATAKEVLAVFRGPRAPGASAPSPRTRALSVPSVPPAGVGLPGSLCSSSKHKSRAGTPLRSTALRSPRGCLTDVSLKQLNYHKMHPKR